MTLKKLFEWVVLILLIDLVYITVRLLYWLKFKNFENLDFVDLIVIIPGLLLYGIYVLYKKKGKELIKPFVSYILVIFSSAFAFQYPSIASSILLLLLTLYALFNHSKGVFFPSQVNFKDRIE